MICNDCPRKCGGKREEDIPGGVCRSPALPMLSRAAPHFGEEPCISGKNGSGTVFFSGCNLRCVFCQNHEISRGQIGKVVSTNQLADIFLRLQDKGVHNINLVTGSHYVRPITKALQNAKLSIPVVWNSSGYDSVESLKMLEGLVQIYLPDFKYAFSDCARRYSAAPDYPEAAKAAISEMFRQRGKFIIDDDGMLQSGVLIRHLILPENEENSLAAIDFVAENFPGDMVLFSLMSQFTPMPGTEDFPELQYRVSSMAYARLCDYAVEKGIEYGFFQDESSATDELIPDFDLSGIIY